MRLLLVVHRANAKPYCERPERLETSKHRECVIWPLSGYSGASDCEVLEKRKSVTQEGKVLVGRRKDVERK